jgi:ribonuclease BN (tRNA processing enzyme)
MRLWVLGSGTLIPHADRGSPAHLLEMGRSFLLLDCGSGTLRTLARLGLPWERISHLLITHFHTDHVGELPALMFAFRHGLPGPRRKALQLLGPVGLEDHLTHLSRAHGNHIRNPDFPVQVAELAPGDRWSDPSGDFQIETAKTNHTEESLAFRVDGEAGTLGYVGDTGPSPLLAPFLEGCQVVLAECSHPDGMGFDNHLTPTTLAALVGPASPELLVPVHVYPPLDPGSVPDLLAEVGYAGKVIPGWDGLCLEWEGRRVFDRTPTQTGVAGRDPP